MKIIPKTMLNFQNDVVHPQNTRHTCAETTRHRGHRGMLMYIVHAKQGVLTKIVHKASERSQQYLEKYLKDEENFLN